MNQTDRTRVVVTGMGWVTPLGHEIESVWQALLAGRSAVGAISHFDASTYPTTFAAEVRDYDARAHMQRPGCHEHIGWSASFALGAARLAWARAGLDEAQNIDLERTGIYLGSGEGTLDFDNYAMTNISSWDAEQKSINATKWITTAHQALSPQREIEQEANMALHHIAMELEVRGPAYNCLTACAASTQAIGEASDILRRGDADIMIAGGSHSMIHPLGVTGFNRLTALSTFNEDPQCASRPFNKSRDGFVIGEGAGIVILETLEHAQQRGAEILAELKGYGSSSDAFRVTDMHPDSRGAIAAMRGAIEDARVAPSDIDYISAHGTGTSENDSVETRAIRALFGEHAQSIPISSIKSMTGHLIAAAGVVEFIVCALAIRDGIIPPTINLDDPDPECDLDYVPNEPRNVKCRTALSNSFGFGGQNDTVVVQRFDA